MATKTKKFETPEEYISSFSKEVQAILRQVQKIIQKAAPDAVETISYNIPAFKLNGGWVFYYSAYSKHFSLACPPPFTVFDEYKEELSQYVVSKSSIKFPFDKPFPGKLIADMAKFRAKELAKQGKGK